MQDKLIRHGAILFRGFAVRTPDDFERIARAIDDDLNAPRALEALDDLASAILSGGDDERAPVVLRELTALLGIDLDLPVR